MANDRYVVLNLRVAIKQLMSLVIDEQSSAGKYQHGYSKGNAECRNSRTLNQAKEGKCFMIVVKLLRRFRIQTSQGVC